MSMQLRLRVVPVEELQRRGAGAHYVTVMRVGDADQAAMFPAALECCCVDGEEFGQLWVEVEILPLEIPTLRGRHDG
jgi:hypothetical protein